MFRTACRAAVALLATLAVSSPVAHAAPQTYFVDCAGGNDAHSGSDPGAAWATLGRVGQANLGPGDGVRLKRGCTWTGVLNAHWNGTADQPVVVAPYGEGDAPLIEAAADSVDLSGSYMVIDGLAFRGTPERIDPGCNNQPVGYRVGVQVKGGAHHNTVRNSYFTSLSMGVFVAKGSSNNMIQKNTFEDVDMMFTLTPKSANGSDDGGAQAILLEGDYNDVSYNTVLGSIACSYDFKTDGAVVEIWGGGHNTIHHNYSENTDIFAEVSLPSAVDNAFSYNIANGHRGLTVHGETSGTKVYNSVFYSVGGSGDNGVVCGGCSNAKLTFKNNIVWAYGGLSTGGAPADEGFNVYWASNGSPYLDVPISNTSKVADPLFAQPGADFRLQPGSPAIDAGTTESVIAGFTTDMDDNEVPGTTAGIELGTYAF